jgi:putative transposase
VRKAFKYKLYPTRQQTAAMSAMLETNRRLYNDALAERKHTWEQEQRSVSYAEQSGQLRALRKTNSFLATANFSSCQATLRRLDKAFQAFFRRVKAGVTAGYPRFKGRSRFDTVEFPSYGDGCRFDGHCIYFQHVGRVKVKLHRPIEGQIKTVAFKREANGWYVIFSCDLDDVAVCPSDSPAIGIDLGLKAFLVTRALYHRSITDAHKQRCGGHSAKLHDGRRVVGVAQKPSSRCKSSISGSVICGEISTTRRREHWSGAMAQSCTKT